jgi:hypothetical protein
MADKEGCYTFKQAFSFLDSAMFNIPPHEKINNPMTFFSSWTPVTEKFMWRFFSYQATCMPKPSMYILWLFELKRYQEMRGLAWKVQSTTFNGVIVSFQRLKWNSYNLLYFNFQGKSNFSQAFSSSSQSIPLESIYNNKLMVEIDSLHCPLPCTTL